ncbi:hypothetical protein T4E_8897 [Trichinella pseudospiralis]|uniref:Uncharacterized protein n=1 Tax=Trichinella pseudospiralis TaxID=6337 RepID=A0A0V0XII5_TRIPS|nr:hypothetical protein T4E_8897 [Trichinella pseudospiralis]
MDASMKRAVKNMIEEEDEGDEWNGMEWNCEVNKKYFIKVIFFYGLLFGGKSLLRCRRIIFTIH